MRGPLQTLADLRRSLRDGSLSPVRLAGEAIASAQGNASRNTYLDFSAPEVLAAAESLERRYRAPKSRPPLYGIPVSVKDCFDVQGKVTTFGTRFYADHAAAAASDSALVRRLREAGCLLTGKTHLHPLAYGITGENPDFGDCVQPRDASLLTGGSSSGAAASVQEGSALIMREDFFPEAEPAVRSAFSRWQQQLEAVPGVTTEFFSADDWPDTVAIFTGIQAHEAAAQHQATSIGLRLNWQNGCAGALRSRHRKWMHSAPVGSVSSP